MRCPSIIPGELLSCSSCSERFSGILVTTLLLSDVHLLGSRNCCGRERRAVVWPVSWLVRGRAWPGGRTLAWRGRAALRAAHVGPAWPPGLARRGSRAWQVGKEPNDAAPATVPPYGQRPGAGPGPRGR